MTGLCNSGDGTVTEPLTLTESQAKLIETALDDLTVLAVLYERRLLRRDRYAREAMLAVMSVKAARAILRSARKAAMAE